MDEETKPDTETAALVEQGERLFEAGKPTEALRVFEQAVARAPLSATAHCNLGAVRWALGRVEEALAGFRRALELAPDHLETALNLARALTAMGRREEAVLVARGFLALRPDADGFRAFVSGAEGPRQQSVPAAGARRLRVAIFSREPDWAALRLRLSAPLGVLSEELDLIWARRGSETEAWFDADCIDECDVVVVQRLFAGPETLALCRRIFSSGRPVVYELDDDFLDVPDTHPFYDMIKGYKPFVLEMLGLSDAVTVTSTALAERVRPYNPQVHVLPNALEPELWRGGWTPIEKPVNGPVVIGFAGTATHKADLALVSEALRRIRAEYGDRVAFRFLGCAPPGLEGVCEARPFELRYGAYAEVLARSDIDIALAPLVDDPFNRCKSDIKWLEYSACGFAGIYSNLPVYRDSIFNGETGLLAENSTEAWFEAINRLVRDPALRRRIGQAARAQVLATRTVEAVAPRYLEVYRRVVRSPRRAIRDGWHPVGDCEVMRRARKGRACANGCSGAGCWRTIWTNGWKRSVRTKEQEWLWPDSLKGLPMCEEAKPDVETAVLVEQGERLFEVGKPAEALRVFEQAVARTPSSAKELHTGRQAVLEQFVKNNDVAKLERHGLSVRDTESCKKRRSQYGLEYHDIALFENRIRTKWTKCPSVHFILIDVRADEQPVINSVASIASQLYSGWGLSVISGRQAITAEFESEPNLEWITTDCLENELEKLVRESSTDWISFLFSGDQVERHYLVSMLDLADVREGVEVVYSDTDSVNDDGEYFDANFKPEADIDLLRSVDYIGNGCLLKTDTVKKNIGLVSLAHYGFVYGLLLKIIEDSGESAFAHDSTILFHGYDENVQLENLPTSISRRKDYLEQHLGRCGLKSLVIEGYRPGVFYVEYEHTAVPLVSVIIPTKDGLEVLEPCISTLLGKTAYRNFEVIVVDNNSGKPETLKYFEKIQRDDPRVKVVAYSRSYNYSAINNMAAELAKGDYLVLLNNDTEIIQEDWLDRMLSLGQREDVGIVGVRLLYPDTTLQHAGVVLGMTGSADHSHAGAPAESPGYRGQNLTVRGVSAVTAACLLIKKDVYFSADGLDEENFAVLFNDVDLCLKVRKSGLHVVYTPHVVLMHHGSFSLKKKKVNKRECLTFIRKWLPVLADDPAYNRNLSLSSQDVRPEDKLVPGWDMHRHDCLRVVAFPTEAWCDDQFCVRPLLSQLQGNNDLRCIYVPAHGSPVAWLPQPVELERVKPDVLLFRVPLPDLHLKMLEYYAAFNKSAFKVLVLDNPQCLPARKYKKRGSSGDKDEQRIRRALACCDRLLVPTDQLAGAWSGVIGDIRVIPDPFGMNYSQDNKPCKQHLDSWLSALTPPEATQTEIGLKQEVGSGYRKWMEVNGLQECDVQRFTRRMMTAWTIQPSIHLLMTHVPGQEEALADTLDALASQIYAGWGLSVVSRSHCPDPIFEALPNLEWVQVEGGPIEGVNRLVQGVSADWIGLLEAGDTFEPDMLYRCVDFLQDRPECRLIYMDEDRIDAAGGHHDPQFKPDFNLELLRGMPYMGRCLLVRRDVLVALGGYAADERVAAYQLALQVSEAGGSRAIGHIPWVLIHRQDRFRRMREDEEEAGALCRRALSDHLARVGIDAVVRGGNLAGTFFADYATLADIPQIEIFIDGDAPAPVLSMTLEHLIAKTDYPALRINLLVTEGCEPSCLQARHERVRLVPYDARQGGWPTIEARIHGTDAPYLLFLRPGVVPLRGNWLARLLGPMQRAEVVVTAPRLVSTDNQVIDGGVVLGGGGYSVGSIAHFGLTADAPGYMGRAQVAQELGSVTDNCLLIRTDAYRAVGGFSAAIDTPLYRAVDLCRRVAAGGGVIVWTPHATLLYVEAAVSETDRSEPERAAEREAPVVCRQWLPELARDPAYNPNLSLRAADFRVAENLPSPVAFDSSQPRILGFGATTFGSWKYRVDQPLGALHREGLAHRFLIDFSENGIAQLPTVAELERLEVDALLFHNAVHDYALDALRLYRKVNHAFVVLGEDDLMTALPPKNPYSKTVYKDIRRRIRRACELADRVVVTTEPLAEALRRYSGDVRVVPNGLPAEIWGSLPRVRRRGGRPRVGWAGASQHHGDLELLREVVEATATEVDWVFFGMCPDFLRPHVREMHDGVPFDAYPAKLASLELDLVVAPLELNDFNRCKSNLRLLEYGVLGWPVIASDIEPYRDAPVCRVRNQARTWIQAIRERIHDLDAAACEGESLRQWVLANGMLEGRLTDWLSVLTAQTGAARGGGEVGQPDQRRQGAG